MNDIILVIGLPGSGKSYLLAHVPEPEDIILDDFNDMTSLPATIPEGSRLYIASLHLCVSWESSISVLQGRYEKCSISTIFFENAPEKAIRNVHSRNDGRVISDAYIRWISRNYKIPPDQEIWKIYEGS